MQSILLPPTRSGGLLSLSPAKISATHLSLSSSPRQYVSFNSPLPFSSPLKKIQALTPIIHTTKILASAPISTNYTPSDDTEKLKLAQVAKRLENTSKYLKRLGSFGFWGQLVCTIVAAVILSFSIVVTGKVTSPATFYATAGGIAAGFISVFWSFGYIRLADKLKRTANNPVKAPPRADVVNSLKNGIVLNLLGMGAAVLGMQATVGFLVAKALTTSSNPFYQGVSPGSSPVLALDVFLVQSKQSKSRETQSTQLANCVGNRESEVNRRTRTLVEKTLAAVEKSTSNLMKKGLGWIEWLGGRFNVIYEMLF